MAFTSERKAKCGSCPGGADLLLDAAQAAALGVADQLQAADLDQRRAVWPVGERRVAAHDQHVRIDEQGQRLVRAGRRRQLDEGEVELGLFDAAVQVEIGLGLARLDAHVRPHLPEAAHDLGQRADADALCDPDAQRDGVDVVERRHIGLGGPQPAEDRLGVDEQDAAGIGQLDPGAAPAPHQVAADGAFERTDVGADRRRHVAELRRGAAERPGPCDRPQRRQVPGLDVGEARLAAGHAPIPLQCGASAARTAATAASARPGSSGR